MQIHFAINAQVSDLTSGNSSHSDNLLQNMAEAPVTLTSTLTLTTYKHNTQYSHTPLGTTVRQPLGYVATRVTGTCKYTGNRSAKTDVSFTFLCM